MNKPVQKFLSIRCDLRLPTVDLAGARAITGLHENALKDLCDSGDLPAWNIARHRGDSRRELRILARACRDYAEDKLAITSDPDFIIRLIYGRERPFVLGRDFYRAWNCDSGHLINLVVDGTLQTVPGTTHGRGRGNTPCITWSSALNFLSARRV